MWHPGLHDQGVPGEEGESAIALLPRNGCVPPIWRMETWATEKEIRDFFPSPVLLPLVDLLLPPWVSFHG